MALSEKSVPQARQFICGDGAANFFLAHCFTFRADRWSAFHEELAAKKKGVGDTPEFYKGE